MTAVAKTFAAELVKSLGLAAPIDPLKVAGQLGLDVQHCDSSGFEGALVCSKANRIGKILVKNSIREPGRTKFTIAHEIAHYVLPHHGQTGGVCRQGDVENWDRSLSSEEREANVFASELLMPRTLVDATLFRNKPTFQLIRNLAKTFQTSLTASAYRTMDLTPFRAAIAWSTRGEVRWFKASEEFEAFVNKDTLSPGSYAYDCFRGLPVPDHLKSVKSELWLAPSRRGEPSQILEHSIWLSNYESVLTLLVIDESGHALTDDDEGLLQEMDPESFTLRRRRWPR